MAAGGQTSAAAPPPRDKGRGDEKHDYKRCGDVVEHHLAQVAGIRREDRGGSEQEGVQRPHRRTSKRQWFDEGAEPASICRGQGDVRGTLYLGDQDCLPDDAAFCKRGRGRESAARHHLKIL
jgi:hypothetical protein